jgi:hypothetical protein
VAESVPDQSEVKAPFDWSKSRGEPEVLADPSSRVGSESTTAVSAENVAQVDKYQAALQGQFSLGSDVRLKVRNQQGNSMLDIKSIPLAEVGTLILALMDHVPPSSQLRQA